MSPQQTMSTAEHLYTRGYISYPRTETTSYPSGFNFHQILRQHTDGKYSSVVQTLLTQRSFNPLKGKDVGDHPPITPQKSADSHLSGDSLRIYEFVLQNFLASIVCLLDTGAKLCLDEPLQVYNTDTQVSNDGISLWDSLNSSD